MVIFFLGVFFSIIHADDKLYDYPVIGIDLGTTYSSVCIQRDDKVEVLANKFGSKTTPTVVALSNDEFIVGEDAKEQAIINPNNTFYDLKRLTGRNYFDPSVQKMKKRQAYSIAEENNRTCIKVDQYGNESNKLFSIDYIQAKVLVYLKQIAHFYLEVPIKNLVITVPISFNNAQKEATIDIAEIAGFNVVRIISEPKAAAIAYGIDNLTQKKIIFVFDFGGGTLDITVVKATKDKFEDLEHQAQPNLGGEDFDQTIVNYFIDYIYKSTRIDIIHNKKAIQVLKTEAQRAKETLSSQKIAHIKISNLIEGYDFNYSLTREKFEELNEEHFNDVIDVINSTFKISNLQIIDIDEVILVGGSSRIPKIQQIIETIFVNSKIIKDRIQDELVCVGAAIYANSLTKEEYQKYQFAEIMKTTISYGVETLGGMMSIIIPKMSKYPLTLSKIYTSVLDYQTRIIIQVFQGENKFTILNQQIGLFELKGIKIAKRGIPEIQVTFSLNYNGLLQVTAFDLDTKSLSQYEIVITNLMRQSKEEIQKQKDESEKEEKIYLERMDEFLIEIQQSKYKNQISQAELSEIKLLLDSSSKWLQENQYKADKKITDFEKKQQDLKNSIDAIMNKKRDL
ncbi:unnamed protein product (macronuclear) [Paramecium tetraurelia]|uniref:Uncharacterized protein n=2 Tax=Paramecium tetraurelia TaxID=5888 RepID=A0CCR8_PARTE|nr:uncharacterized protein GSPATT00037370001 [Paramecium tetraurelia]CAK68585.1 unnamed protein product [Paramecium tetraurelia]|eukprot:XP_001435982.1 hypothetical protein (macronuclear) [Paramecium tetraurelia strain d4-2]